MEQGGLRSPGKEAPPSGGASGRLDKLIQISTFEVDLDGEEESQGG
jgi:hypothetical protein